MLREDILIASVLSEKTTMLREQQKYVFKVHIDANKFQIKDAIEKLFEVKVVKCTVMNVFGKTKRVRSYTGHTSGWKKTVVKLMRGEIIKMFEGM
ncbi:50S ribosomal protein L23 [Treponema endosymbiont of Eucomonympha sp.]|jgi:large subunit ribosomal protein L23|uniref:50S ribosomal protein L23 n=1 Tax=Treponema endosymbiont of Eucomonympha sp. TaxID=1580831 RepID=UPI000780ADE7|nr:50S ribosomal protein L23 [Treponema endosymbiont of Eucomonympha sp.]